MLLVSFYFFKNHVVIFFFSLPSSRCTLMLLGTATALCFLWLFGFSYGFSLHLAEKGGMSFLHFVLSLLAFFRPLDLFDITPSLARVVVVTLTGLGTLLFEMGNNASTGECAAFDVDEIRRLEKRFRKLDANGSGTLSPDGQSVGVYLMDCRKCI